MPTKQSIRLIQSNDETLAGTITDDSTGLPLNLTGVTLTMRIKHGPQTPDADADTILSTTTGEITVVDAAAGTYRVAVPAAALAAAGIRWYRVDATTSDASTRTVAYGTLQTVDV